MNIGDLVNGGLLFYINEAEGYGLVVSINAIGQYKWYDGQTANFPNLVATSEDDGENNTKNITEYLGEGNTGPFTGIGEYAARKATLYEFAGYSDWYLPALNEAIKLAEVGLQLGFNTGQFIWTSTEIANDEAWVVNITHQGQSQFKKYSSEAVYVIRKITVEPAQPNLFFNTIEEVKNYNSAISSTLELVNIQSYLDDAVNFFLVPVIGIELIDELIAVKNSEDITVYQSRLIKYLQKAAVGYAISNYSDNGAVNIGNTGIGVTRSEKSAPASDKKLLALKRANLKSAYQARELAVEYLETNISEFPTYSASEQHKQNRTLLINNAKEFQEAGVNIGFDAQLYYSLRTYIDNATENVILPLLGETYLAALKTAILNNTISDFQKQLLKRIRKPLAASAMAEAIPYRAVSIDANGIFELSETVGGISGNVENRRSADEQRLKAVMSGFRMRADQELQTLKNFINANADVMGIPATEAVNINDGSAPNVYFF